MYVCQQCDTQVGPGIAQMRKVVETRAVVYEHVVRAGRKSGVKTTEGWEIVREINVCKDCAD